MTVPHRFNLLLLLSQALLVPLDRNGVSIPIITLILSMIIIILANASLGDNDDADDSNVNASDNHLQDWILLVDQVVDWALCSQTGLQIGLKGHLVARMMVMVITEWL